MINLLPTDEKTTIMYARRNRKLLRWSLSIGLIIVGMLMLIGAGHVYIANATTSYSKQVDRSRESLKAQKLSETQQRILDLSNNLKLIIQVLSREVLFSKLLQQVGAVMPAKSVLSNIEISKVEGGIDLIAEAQDYDTATQIQVNLQDPRNKLFDKVDIVSVSCGVSTNGGYPCTVNLRALFSKTNP